MVVLGVKMIYVPWMPGHRKRLTQTYVTSPTYNTSQCCYTTHTHTHTHTMSWYYFSMIQLIKPTADKVYVDLTVSFANPDGDDSPGPPVRYYFQN